MDIHFKVRKGEILYHVESFLVQRQDSPCPPEILSVLLHKIQADLSTDSSLRRFEFPFKECPMRVTIDMMD